MAATRSAAFFLRSRCAPGYLGAFSLNIGHNSGRATTDARTLREILNGYRDPSDLRSIAEVAITALPLIALWTAAWLAYWLGHPWASLLVAAPAAGFLLRLFMIQHDCGHGAFFSDRRANDWIGRFIGVITLTPYDLLAPHSCHSSCDLRQSGSPRHR